MADEKKSFVIYESWATMLANIPEEQAGQIIKAICCKKLGIEYEIEDQMAAGFFKMIVPQLDKDAEKYAETVEKRKEAIHKRWDKKQKNKDELEKDTSVIQNDTNELQMNTVSDSVSVSDSDNNKIPTESMNVNYQEIVDSYHELCPDLPKVTKLSDARRKAIRARLRTYSVEDLKKAFAMVEASDFLRGKNGRNWSATFDWILKDTNLAKILDGNYNNRDRPVQRSDITDDPVEAPTSSQEDIDRIARAMRKRGAY